MPPRQPHPVRPSAARGTRGGGLGGELSPLGSATPRRTVFRVGSPCTVAQSFGQQKASTTPTAWPKLTQSLTQWDRWRGGIAKRIKWLRLTAKHLKSVEGNTSWEFEPPSRHCRSRVRWTAGSPPRLCAHAV